MSKVRYDISTPKLPRELGQESIGKQVLVEGVVSRISEVLSYPQKVTFVCRVCGHRMEESCKPWEKPIKLRKCEKCKSKDIEIDGMNSYSERYQIFRIQDPPEALEDGTLPMYIDGVITGSLVGNLKLGSRVRITGTLTVASRNVSGNQGFVLNNVLEAIHVDEVTGELSKWSIQDGDIRKFHEEIQRKDFKQRIINSILPNIKGYNRLKECLLLALLGGSGINLRDGTRLRKNIHVLVVDEQQKASQVLNAMTKIFPGMIYVEGSSLQRAELVAKTTRDELTRKRLVEAGPLTLANGNIVIIEELDKLPKRDKDTLAKVMEQEVASITQAGINSRFPVQTTVIAVINPRPNAPNNPEPLTSRLNISPKLLSVFDLVCVVPEVSGENNTEDHYDLEFVRKFILYARKLNPVISREVLDSIEDHYETIRDKETDLGLSSSNAHLQFIIRLAIAHAKLYLRETVTKEDAKAAIELVENVLGREYTESTPTRLNKAEKIEIIRDIVYQFGSSTPQGVSEEKLIEEATKRGIPENEVQGIVSMLIYRGEVYMPSFRHYKLTL